MTTIAIGQRVNYQRRGNIYSGVVEGVDQGSIAGVYYWIRNDASQIRNAVLPQQIIRDGTRCRPRHEEE